MCGSLGTESFAMCHDHIGLETSRILYAIVPKPTLVCATMSSHVNFLTLHNMLDIYYHCNKISFNYNGCNTYW